MLTKMTKTGQQSCNDAPKVLNDGLINGDAAELLNGENGGMVRMRRWMISTCNRRKNKTGARVKISKDDAKVLLLGIWAIV